MLHKYLTDEHFEQSLADHCVYTRFNADMQSDNSSCLG